MHGLRIKNVDNNKDNCTKDEETSKESSASAHDSLSYSLSKSISDVLNNSTYHVLVDGLLDTIVSSLPGYAHIKHGKQFEYKIANQNTFKLLGMSQKEQLIGSNDYDVAKHMQWRWPIGFADDLLSTDHDILRNNNSIIGKTHQPYINAEGKLVAFSITKIPLYDHEQKPYGVLTFAIDTVDLKNSDKLRGLYRQFYKDEKLAHQKFIEHIGLTSISNYSPNQSSLITTRELDVLILLAKGKTAKETARHLGISPRTVETHIENAKNKLNCNTKSDLIGVFLSCYRNNIG